MSNSYTDRSIYRGRASVSGFTVAYKSSELFICAEERLKDLAQEKQREIYSAIEAYISAHPDFGSSLSPIADDPSADATIRAMLSASAKAGVGPMAAVAGAVAGYIGKALLKTTGEVFLENGGDIYMKSEEPRTVAVFAGASPLSMKVGVTVPAGEWGICTSSGTVGPSVSFGLADAAVVLSSDVCLADACATKLGNLIKSADDIANALDEIYAISGVCGAIGIIGDKLGAIGDISLCPLG